jgi:hypothetical protein
VDEVDKQYGPHLMFFFYYYNMPDAIPYWLALHETYIMCLGSSQCDKEYIGVRLIDRS